MIRKVGLALVALFTSAAVCLGFPASKTAMRGSGSLAIGAQILSSGGIQLDWQTGEFMVKVPGSPEARYSNFTALYTALGGSYTGSQKYCYNQAGIYTLVPASTPAQPCYTGDGALRGLYMENATTNFLLRSEDFSNAVWSKTGVTQTAASLVAPPGTTVGTKLKEDSSTGNHWVLQSVTKTAAAQVHTASCFVYPYTGGRNVVVYVDDNAGNGVYAIFDLSGAVATPSTGGHLYSGSAGSGFTLTATWQDGAGVSGFNRVAITVTTNSATTIRYACGMADGSSISYAGDNDSAIGIWGAQLEEKASGATEFATSPSSYTPTTSATVARVTDQFTLNMPAGLQGMSAYSIYLNLRLARAANGLGNTFLSIEDSTNAHRITLGQNNAGVSNSFFFQIVDTSTTTITMSGPLLTFDQDFGLAAVAKSGAHWTENSSQSIKTSTAVNYPSTSLTKVQFNSTSTGATLSGNIGYKQVAIFPTNVATAQMERLLFPTPIANPDQIRTPNYFTNSLLGSVVPSGTRIWRSTRLPTSDSESNTTFTNYPITDAYSIGIAALVGSTTTAVKDWFLLWQNRCDLCAGAPATAKPNNAAGTGYNYNGISARVSFTTYDRADAVTLAQSLYLAGWPQHAAGPCPTGMTYCGWQDPVDAVGITTITDYDTAKANPGTYFTTIRTVAGVSYATAIDILIKPNGILSQLTSPIGGIFCDCERADNALASRVTEQMRQMALAVHNKGYNLAVITDGLTGAGVAGGYCGVGIVASNCDQTNLNTILGYVDVFFYSNGFPAPKGYTFDSWMSYAYSLFGTLSAGQADKIGLQVNLGTYPGGLTLAAAQSAHNFIVANGIKNVSLAPVFWTPGGDQCRYSNINIETVLGLSTGSC